MELWNGSSPENRVLISLDINHNYGASILIHEKKGDSNPALTLAADTFVRIEERTGPKTMAYSDAVQRAQFGATLWDILIHRRDHCKPRLRRLCAWLFYVAIAFATLAFLTQLQWVALAMF